LLIALEEEAAIDTHPELREVLLAQKELRVRSMAGAATWDLSRLDALAMQVRSLLLTSSSSSSSEQSAEDDSLQQLASSGHAAGAAPTPEHIASAAVDASSLSPTSAPKHAAHLPPGMFEREPLRVLRALNTVLFEWHGHAACNRYGQPQDSHLTAVLERGLGSSPALTILYMQVGTCVLSTELNRNVVTASAPRCA
jgi:hypothetical protein